MAARTRQLADPMRIGEAVAARRQHLGLTQEEACALSDRAISKAVWSLIENARQDTYRTRSLDAVRSVLAWPRDWIERIELDHEDLTDIARVPSDGGFFPEASRRSSILHYGGEDVSPIERRIERLERRLAQLGRVVARELEIELDLLDDERPQPMPPAPGDDEDVPPTASPRP